MWTAGAPGKVSDIYGHVPHFQAVLDGVGSEFVVIKFKREGCQACKATVTLLEEAAVKYKGRVRFFMVDYNFSKDLCRLAGLKVVPCTHIYHNNVLVDTMGLSRTAWDAFIKRLDALLVHDQKGLVLDPPLAGTELREEGHELDQRIEEAFRHVRLSASF